MIPTAVRLICCWPVYGSVVHAAAAKAPAATANLIKVSRRILLSEFCMRSCAAQEPCPETMVPAPYRSLACPKLNLTAWIPLNRYERRAPSLPLARSGPDSGADRAQRHFVDERTGDRLVA